jgi:aminoglycoside phosphotransferase (APT) family kinase protein
MATRRATMRSAGGRVGLELARLGIDALRRRGRPSPAAAALSRADLSRLLGHPIRAARALDGTSGTTDRARFELDGARTVFVKRSALAAGTRLFGGLARLGEVEVGFYRDLRPLLDLEAPRVVATELDRMTGRFVIVLEDLAARGATFVDTLTPLTVDQAAGALTTLARLHAGTQDLVPAPTWLDTNSGDALLPVVARSLGPLARRVEKSRPALLTTEGRELLATYRHWASVLDHGPSCVLHGDPHPGNVYLVDNEVGLLDWQAVRRGHPLRDVAYRLTLGLDTRTRRASERDLLDYYRAELAAYGGPRFDPEEVWGWYRRMVAYAYVAAAFTFGLGGLQDDDIADEGLRRAVAAGEDHDTARLIA